MSQPSKIPLCPAMILFEKHPNTITYLKACNPSDFNFMNIDLSVIINNAFPPMNNTKNKSHLMYVFSCHDLYCYDWVIVRSNCLYSIIILSRLKMPYLYLSFLEELEKEFLNKDESEKFDPLVLLDYSFSLISSWKWVSPIKLLVHHPQSSFYVELENCSFCFQEFNPFEYFKRGTEMVEIWKTIITGSGLLLVSDDPEILSSAVFAAVSLLSPFYYKDSILITLDSEDDRLQSIENYKIVATTPNIKQQLLMLPVTDMHSSFGYITEVHFSKFNGDLAKLRQPFYEKTKKAMDLAVFLMDRMLRKNPYNDLLEGPYITDDIDDIFNGNKKNKKKRILTPDAFRMMEKTQTVVFYRRQVSFRNQFRQNLLSMKPEEALKALSRQHLKILGQKLEDIENRFISDTHLVSVIHLHMKIIDKLLGRSESEE